MYDDASTFPRKRSDSGTNVKAAAQGTYHGFDPGTVWLVDHEYIVELREQRHCFGDT